MGADSTELPKTGCAHALKGLTLPCESLGGITLVGSWRLHSTLAVAPVLFARVVVAEIEIGRIISPSI